MNNSKTKAIIFDLGGVLFVKRTNITAAEMVNKIDQMVGGCVNDLELMSSIKDIYNINNEELDKIAEKIAFQFEPNSKIWQVIPDLAKKYKLAVINNGASFTLPHFKKLAPIDRYFPLFLCSGQIGFKKPNPEIYQLALEKLECLASECVFIDDLQENVEGAKALGIKSILWTKDSKIQDLTNVIKL